MATDMIKVGQSLNAYIRPQTYPVAVRMAASAEEIPDKTRMPKRDMKRCITLCQGIALARRHGWVVAMAEEDMLCPLGSLTLGLLPAKDRFLEGGFNVPFWVSDQDTRAKMARSIPRLEVGKYTHVMIAPVQRAEFEPDVIVVYGDPAQVSRLVQAAMYATGDPLVSNSAGGFACGFEITVPMLTGECQFILTGGGDRALAQAQDHEVAFAIPAARAQAIAEGLEATHKAGMRYPTPALMPFGGVMPPGFDELTEHLRQAE